MQWRIRITKLDIMNKSTIELQTVNDALQPPLQQHDVAGSAVGRREILEKHWHQFRIASGLSYEPMSEKAYEYFELAMQEYTEIFIRFSSRKPRSL